MKSFKQPKNFLSKRKKYIRQRDKGIIDGKTREVWKKLAQEKSQHDSIDLDGLSRKHKQSAFLARQRKQEKDRVRRENLETLEFIDAIISSIKT